MSQLPVIYLFFCVCANICLAELTATPAVEASAPVLEAAPPSAQRLQEDAGIEAAPSESECAAEEVPGSGKISAAAQSQAATIIHGASALAAVADGGLAQLPGAGSVVIPTIQAAMVYKIGALYGCHLDRSKALTVVTYLASNHVKKAIAKEVIGFIPFMGNIVKSSITLFMTEGIGKMAENMLRCGTTSQELLFQAAEFKPNGANAGSNALNVEPPETESRARHLFHTVTDYLANLDIGSLTKEEAWLRLKQLVSMQGQDQLLNEVRSASGPDELLQLVRRHTWNLEVVEAALHALEERFDPSTGACLAVDFVVERIWVPEASDVEGRAAVSHYLHGCTRHARLETQAAIFHAAARLIVEAANGARWGIQPVALQSAVQLFEQTVTSAVEVDAIAASRKLPSLFGGLLRVFSQGEPSACEALRTVLRIERRVAQDLAKDPAPWAAVRHLHQLDNPEVRSDAYLCLAELRADMTKLLQLPAIPSEAELPSLPATPSRGERDSEQNGGTLQNALAAIVGQRCMLERLQGHPGFARLKHKGLWRDDMPLVLLLTGPSGTGKTLLARTLAEAFLGRPIKELEGSGQYRIFHMSFFSLMEDQKSFFGPPKGIVGTGDLPELLKEWPNAVVLLDEVEKAHPSFARALLKVFGENGAVYDPRTGKDVPTTNATFILTSNLGKEFITDHVISRGNPDQDYRCEEYAQIHKDMKKALKEPLVDGRPNFFMESELRSRVNDVLPFIHFSPKEVEEGVRRFLAHEAKTFAKGPEFKNAMLAWDPSVVPFLAAEYQRRREEGLRGVQVQLQVRVREVVQTAIEANLLESFGAVVLRTPHPLDNDGSGRLDARLVPPSGIARSARSALVQDGGRQRAEGTVDGSLASWAWGSESAPQASTTNSDGGHASAWFSDKTWDVARDWDWSLTWQQVREFLWEWRFPLAIFVAMVFASSSAPVLGAVASSTAMAAPAASAPAATLGTAGAAAATAWLPSIVAMLQLALSAGTTAMPILTAAYAWQHRREIVAIIWIVFAAGTLPTLIRSALRLWELWRCTASRLAIWGCNGAMSPQCCHGQRSDGRIQGEQRSPQASGKPKRRRPARSPPPKQRMEAGRWTEPLRSNSTRSMPIVALAGPSGPQEIVTVMGRTVLECSTPERQDETESGRIDDGFGNVGGIVAAEDEVQ